jgi:uncharacterized protein YacL
MFIRIFYGIFCAGVAVFLFSKGEEYQLIGVLGAVTAVALGFILEFSLRRIPVGIVLGGALGLLGGSLTAMAVGGMARSLLPDTTFHAVSPFFLMLLFGYIGTVVGIKAGTEVKGRKFGVLSSVQDTGISQKILDTSVIIDGRIADLCETGFLEGRFIIPQFVLQELQRIADSSDSLKRARGRRGLDILHRIQKMTEVDVRIIDTDYPQVRDVDGKLVVLGKELDAKVITNDLNLNKVAELQGVKVLNINELCNALRPVVLPGESMRVFVTKEGKEAGQGVAYLDDGTMIVVDNGKRLIGKNTDVVVTSVLQTTAGRMIFTRIREDSEREIAAGGVRS